MVLALQLEEAMGQQLDDHIVMLQSMGFSPYKKPFEDRLAKWDTMLNLVRAVSSSIVRTICCMFGGIHFSAALLPVPGHPAQTYPLPMGCSNSTRSSTTALSLKCTLLCASSAATSCR
jgi:hypothetical protein